MCPNERYRLLFRSPTHKGVVKEISRLVVTVALSVIVTMWMIRDRGRTHSVQIKPRAKAGTARTVSSIVVPLGGKEELYRYHVEEVFRGLKLQGELKRSPILLPSFLLRYQSKSVTPFNKNFLQLEAHSDEVPYLVLPKKMKAYLQKMGVVFIDPVDLPQGLLEAHLKRPLPFNKALVKDKLLVPDMTGNQAAYFIVKTE